MRKTWSPEDHQGGRSLAEFVEVSVDEVRPGDLIAYPVTGTPITYATIHSVRKGDEGQHPVTERISHTGAPLDARTDYRTRHTASQAGVVYLFPVEGAGQPLARDARVLVCRPETFEWAILGTLLAKEA